MPAISLIAPAAGTHFAIDGNGDMPVITAEARIVGLPTSTAASIPLTWTVRVRFTASVCPHGPARNINHPDIVQTAVGSTFRIPFSEVRGGTLSIRVRATIAGRHVEAHSANLDIRGTNPTSADLNAALPHVTLRKIARQESGGGRQFAAAADGGVGKCPLWSGDNLGGVGIMQITVPRPTDDQVWNWRANVAEGVRIFQQKVAAARGYPAQVRRSQGFQTLVAQFNAAHHKHGQAAIPIDLPDFTTGDFDTNLQQLELDSIRGFNGFGGRDRFGLHLHEFRVAVDAHGLLRVNLDPAGTRGTAIWERVPVADRPQGFGDPDYVNHVLARTI
ncbi:hypothetical protein [Paludisphaera borealis]|uniref:Uncharacterized protein n=1 Tax=Paludisphaera borealis TaxID=1387353 RepID=A0A1U7CTF2_9BACT|nr:hypothetical protein [Paludisphaera borealis]APW62202.1 hypothetical protein BSF38_03737 [Paludisphaera borealis]